MILEDKSPAANAHPAGDIERVVARVANVVANEGAYGLIACKFKDIAQFRQALTDTGFKIDSSRSCAKDEPKIAETLVLDVTDKDGSRWGLLVNVWNEDTVEVMNVTRLRSKNVRSISGDEAQSISEDDLETLVKKKAEEMVNRQSEEILARLKRDEDKRRSGN